MKKTFHLVSLPHTQVTPEFDHCAYTAKVRKFAEMMTSLGHDVYLYASEENTAPVKELITVITKEKQAEFGFRTLDYKKHFFNITWNPSDPHWKYMNGRAIEEIKKRIQPTDFIAIIGGTCQEEIAKAFPNHMSVEWGIGYNGTFSDYRVFESYSHMHFVHGLQNDDNGNFYDTVIPNSYDINEFPFSEEKDDYYFFIGRLISRKGYNIAQQVCEKLGKRLILAGQGDFDGYGEHIGVVDAAKRGELMSKAKAVFVPTTYIEPFGGVHAEALLAGTPVITTNFGVFTETVVQGVNGWRCDTFQDFLDGVQWADSLTTEDRKRIRELAQGRFDMELVKYQYDAYFDRLLDLWRDGWYSTK